VQHIGNVLNTSEYAEIYRLSLEQFAHKPNLRQYFIWAFVNKRSWSNFFAGWCEKQKDLTHEKLTEQWRYNAKFYRNKDLWEAIDRQNEIARLKKAMQANSSQPLQNETQNLDEELPY